jgi:hypothetical protein
MQVKMTKETLFKSWVFTNLIGSVSIIIKIFLANLILDQIDMDVRRLTQVAIGIFLFFLFGLVLTLPHFLYSYILLRKNHETHKLWGKIWKTMLVPYLLLITVVVAVNLISYGNPIYELPNLFLLGILILHFVVGIFVWRYYLQKVNSQ